MKRLNYSWMILLTAGMILVSCSGKPKSDTDSSKGSEKIETDVLKVDLAASKVYWKGEMLGLYSHEGTVDITDASLEVSDGNVSGGKFKVDLTTMTPTDEGYNPEEGRSKEKLVGHLSSPDFFDVENYPTSTFVITGVDGSTVTGDLTIRGITHEESVENVTVVKEGEKYNIEGKITFDRTKYDVKFQMTMQDMVLSDEIQLKIKLVAS